MPLTSAYWPRPGVVIAVLLSGLGRLCCRYRPGGPARLTGVPPIASFEFAGPLWPHAGPDGWHFVTLPPGISADIKGLTAGPRRGFGSVRVAVTVGATSWQTSIFPSRDADSYVLPVKRSVRVAEGLDVGDEVRASVHVDGP